MTEIGPASLLNGNTEENLMGDANGGEEGLFGGLVGMMS